MTLPRVLMVLLAAVVGAWFALGARQAAKLNDATGIVTAAARPAAPALARASSDLRAAAVLNPDRQVDILRGRVAILRGHTARARRILRAVTRAEPLNLNAWIWFTGASLGHRRLARLGSARIAALDPQDAGAVGR